MGYIILHEAEVSAIVEGTLVGVAPSFPPPIREAYMAAFMQPSHDYAMFAMYEQCIFFSEEAALAYLESHTNRDYFWRIGARPNVIKVPIGE